MGYEFFALLSVYGSRIAASPGSSSSHKGEFLGGLLAWLRHIEANYESLGTKAR